MAARATTITTAVVNLLNSAGLDMVVTRESGAINIHLDGNTNTNCFVYPGTTSVTAETRGWARREVTVFVHLFRFLDEADETTQVDGLYELVESIEDTLDNKRLDGFEFLQFASDSSSREMLDPDTQTSRFAFETMIQVTYYDGR